jgi:hypothetical protein
MRDLESDSNSRMVKESFKDADLLYDADWSWLFFFPLFSKALVPGAIVGSCSVDCCVSLFIHSSLFMVSSNLMRFSPWLIVVRKLG